MFKKRVVEDGALVCVCVVMVVVVVLRSQWSCGSGVRRDGENKLGPTVPQVRGPDVTPVSVTGFALDEERWQPLSGQCVK